MNQNPSTNHCWKPGKFPYPNNLNYVKWLKAKSSINSRLAKKPELRIVKTVNIAPYAILEFILNYKDNNHPVPLQVVARLAAITANSLEPLEMVIKKLEKDKSILSRRAHDYRQATRSKNASTALLALDEKKAKECDVLIRDIRPQIDRQMEIVHQTTKLLLDAYLPTVWRRKVEEEIITRVENAESYFVKPTNTLGNFLMMHVYSQPFVVVCAVHKNVVRSISKIYLST
ncbi:MAG: hypothetical protein V1707_03415 [bacterium]